jgi:hypothetical protein
LNYELCTNYIAEFCNLPFNNRTYIFPDYAWLGVKDMLKSILFDHSDDLKMLFILLPT